MPKKLTYEFVKEQIEKEGYFLISKKYKNIDEKLEVECNKGHKYNVTFGNFFKRGTRCRKCYFIRNTKENHPNWKGGVYNKKIPIYDTYAPQLEWAEKVRRNKDNYDILEVKCAYCGKWHVPKTNKVIDRIKSLNNKGTGENKFYCSTSCKKECPIFNQKLYPKGYKKSSSREVQPELRQMVFERDGYACQKCCSTKSLHCHHIEGIRWEPLESADIDKCITYCKQCHKEVHKIEECRTVDMQCKEILLVH